MGGLATVLIGGVGVVGEFTDGRFMSHPFEMVLHIYLVFFGVTAVLLESDAEMLHGMPVVGPLAIHLHQYHKFVNEYAKFLSRMRGRGAFYIFVGSFCVTDCQFCPTFLVGVANGCLGLLLM